MVPSWENHSPFGIPYMGMRGLPGARQVLARDKGKGLRIKVKGWAGARGWVKGLEHRAFMFFFCTLYSK